MSIDEHLQHIYKLCIIHYKRNINYLKNVSNEIKNIIKAIPNCKTQAEVKKAFEIIENCEYKSAKELNIEWNGVINFERYNVLEKDKEGQDTNLVTKWLDQEQEAIELLKQKIALEKKLLELK
ncbi:hypothetical protein RhiirA5_465314 [Rhizophagus irregularis]|uniref:Uncharacterized protein n=1 Tax=Rhizophagus irregularis TaxID=588596 RepID=A0A2N0PZ37_9GLOM|nr:hypothetical protein RhiirA5_465314 [Rhizophagus irregularis]